MSDKKKIKLLKKMYKNKKRFIRAIGAALSVEGNNSDFLASVFEFVKNSKKKMRGLYLMAYAEAFKRVKTRYFRVDSEFCEENKRLIKMIKRCDRGYRKAFKNLNGAKRRPGRPPKDSGMRR